MRRSRLNQRARQNGRVKDYIKNFSISNLEWLSTLWGCDKLRIGFSRQKQ